MRVSWILMPGILLRPLGMGRASRWNRGKSTWTLSSSRLEAGQAIGNRDQLLPQRVQILQPFVQAQILEPVDADLQAEEGGELFVHARHQAFAVDPQHMMAVVELFQHAVQLAANSLVLADAEDLGDLVGGEAKQPNSQERSKILWIGK